MKRVLVVDDETEIVELLSMVLDSGDVTVLTAYDGEQALDIIDSEHPQVVLTDVMMPRLDGRELCRRIKANPDTKDTKVILMSAIHRIDPSECGADALIRKPFDILSISQTVEDFLS